MFKSILKLFRSDGRFIAHRPMTLYAFSGLFIVCIFLRFLLPVISPFVFSKSGFAVDKYYSLVAITLVCIIPYVSGMMYANVLREERGYQSSDHQSKHAGKNYLLVRMFFATIICFVFVFLTILLVKPVPTEGWLRNLFAACLLSIQAPFVCLMICILSEKKVKPILVFILSCIYLITVPFGLLVHHPWNYFVFFSPFYWAAWAWVIKTPVESFIYGAISVFITSVALTVVLSDLLRKKST